MGLSGFNLRKVLSSVGSDLLQTIVKRGHIDLYRHLWNHGDFLNQWTVEDLQRVIHVIISDERLTEQILEFHLTEGSN
jgi:23S rRNA G2069 N7-methylase RlmK/C1962 C5-methylase RlmI